MEPDKHLEMAPLQPLRLIALVVGLAVPPLMIDFVVEEWLLAGVELDMAQLLLLRTCIMCAWVTTTALAVLSYRSISKRRSRKERSNDNPQL
jgi:hypothetical protein